MSRFHPFDGQYPTFNSVFVVALVSAFVDVGAGTYLFDGFTDLAATAAVGTSFELSQKLRVPVKFRADVLFDQDAMMIPFGLTVGLAYDLSR